MIKILKILVLLFLPILGLSQGEIIEKKALNYYNEHSFGAKLISSGAGIDYRFGWRYTNKTRGFAEASFSFVKDPKEIKVYNPYFDNQKKFIYGKVNSVFNLHIGSGIKKEIFSKQDKNSISITYQLAGGCVLGLEKPIYYQVVDSSEIIGNQQIFYTSPQKFSLNHHNPVDIVSRESFFKGIGETKVKPGVYARAAFNFEFSNDRYKTKAIEIGTYLEAFPKKITILAEHEKQIFFAMYCSYRFGFKYSTSISRDARKFFRKEEKKEN
ncbi:MAG: hypothetical protein ACQES1_00460 [Bacteroidota bacterium]